MPTRIVFASGAEVLVQEDASTVESELRGLPSDSGFVEFQTQDGTGAVHVNPAHVAFFRGGPEGRVPPYARPETTTMDIRDVETPPP